MPKVNARKRLTPGLPPSPTRIGSSGMSGIGIIQWFARGGGIARAGPFDTQVEAAASLMLRSTGHPVPDAFVWPEVVP